MKLPQFGVPPLTDDLTIPHDNRTNQWIRAHPSPPALGKLQRPVQVSLIRVCELGVHETD